CLDSRQRAAGRQAGDLERAGIDRRALPGIAAALDAEPLDARHVAGRVETLDLLQAGHARWQQLQVGGDAAQVDQLLGALDQAMVRPVQLWLDPRVGFSVRQHLETWIVLQVALVEDQPGTDRRFFGHRPSSPLTLTGHSSAARYWVVAAWKSR